MVIEQIIYYLQGKLSEEEAIELWENLVLNPKDLEILETYLVLKDIFNPDS